MPIPNRIRYVNKRFTNRVMMIIAGKKHSPIALIRHRGRKSGNLYAIPVLVVKVTNQYTFALTYGKNVDWYKNIMAAGWAELQLNGCEHSLISPRALEPEIGRKAFGSAKAKILKWFGVNDFFVMDERVKSEVI